jgi:hypothetical protein
VYQEAEFRGFNGLNNKYSNIEIADTESPDCLNVEFDAVGAITKRKGYTPALSYPGDGKTIYSIIPYYGSTNHLLITSGTSIYDATQTTSTNATWNYYNVKPWNSFASGTTWNSISTYLSPYVITSTLNANGARFSAALDAPHLKLYMVNGNSTDGLMCWDGTNLTKISGAPNGRYLLYYKNHMYMAGDPNAPWRLYMSAQGDPTTWPALNYIDFPDGKGGITGLAQLGDSIVVFKEQGVFILKGSDPSNYVVVSTFAGQRGAVSHWSIVRIPNGLVFLARDGVWLFDGKKFELISDKIQGSVNQWNQSQLQNAVAFEYDHKYWLSVPEGTGQTTNNYTYVFSYLYGWWTRYDIPMQSCAVYTNPNPTPYFADTNGNLLQAENGDNDNGEPIDAYLVTKNFDFGSPAHLKSFKQIFCFAEATTGNYDLTLTFIEDFGVNTKTTTLPLPTQSGTQWGNFLWGAADWGGKGNIASISTNVPGQARYIQFKLENNGANQPFTFLGWIVRYKVKKRMA